MIRFAAANHIDGVLRVEPRQTAGFGEGHNAAARNIRDALEHISDDVKVEVLDLFETSYGSINELVKKAYLGA